MPAYPGPTAMLKGTARRSGRSGTVWINGNMHGEIVNIEWGRDVEQTPIPIPGTYQNELKPGEETPRMSFNYHDVDDRWRLFVWRYLEARRNGDRGAAGFPEFDIITKINDIGAPMASVWVLEGCQIFGYDGGHGQDEALLTRAVQGTYRRDRPLEAFEYGPAGVIVTRG